VYSFEVTGVDADKEKGVEVRAKTGEAVKARWLITCAGLQSDYVGYMAGGAKDPTVLPFRGTYHELKPDYRHIVTRNIYPVPDPKYVANQLNSVLLDVWIFIFTIKWCQML
jgi:L-2-hydroxyglutarate oxidase LhgO